MTQWTTGTSMINGLDQNEISAVNGTKAAQSVDAIYNRGAWTIIWNKGEGNIPQKWMSCLGVPGSPWQLARDEGNLAAANRSLVIRQLHSQCTPKMMSSHHQWCKDALILALICRNSVVAVFTMEFFFAKMPDFLYVTSDVKTSLLVSSRSVICHIADDRSLDFSLLLVNPIAGQLNSNVESPTPWVIPWWESRKPDQIGFIQCLCLLK